MMLFEYRYDCYRGHFHILDNTKFRQQASYRKGQNLNWVFVSITVIPFAVSAIAILMEDAYPDIHAVKFMQEQVNLPKAARYRRVCLYPSYIHWYYCSNKVMGAQEYISHDQPSSWIHHAYVSNCLRV